MQMSQPSIMLTRIQILTTLSCMFFFISSQAYSSYFTCSSYPSLTTGLTVMGASTTTSSSRSVQVKRGSSFLSSGDTYVAGESLTVSLSLTSGDVILEASGGAAFNSGQCAGNKRYYGHSRTLVMPTGGSLSTVEVWAAWAPQHGPVAISTHFSLLAPAPTLLPTPAPVFSPPTAVPSAPPSGDPSSVPSLSPSFTPSHTPSTSQPTSPSSQPTNIPTSHPITSPPTVDGETHLPTAVPSASPSAQPSAAPSSAPSTIPSTTPSSQPTQTPLSSPSAIPSCLPTTSPSSSPTLAPSPFPSRSVGEDSPMYSLSVTAVTGGAGGVTVAALQEHRTVLGETICAHLGLHPALCIVAFIGDATGTIDVDDISFTVLVNGFSSSSSAELAHDELQRYLTELPSASLSSSSSATGRGFIADFATNSGGLQLVAVSYLTGSVTDVSAGEGSNSGLGYSCDLADSLRLSWEVVSVGDGVTAGRAGGLVQLSLEMMKSGTNEVSPWFGGGIVHHDVLSMVPSSGSAPNVVYLYLPSSQAVGEYTLEGYSASAIHTDPHYRADSGVIGVVDTAESTTIIMQRSRVTGVDTDPVLLLDSESGFNALIWAHGGVWPGAHSRSNRGFSDVYWLSGECVATPEAEASTWILFLALFLALLLLACVVVRLRAVKMVVFLRSSIGACISLTWLPSEVIGLPISAIIFCLLFLAIVLLYIVLTAQFYMDEKGYDVTRAYGSATGFAALFLVGITTLPVNKTSLWVRLLHIPYDRATKFHRWCGMLSVALITLHLFITANFWGRSKVLTFDLNSQIGAVYPAFGCLAVFTFWLMAVTASYPMRVWSYELFQSAHILCFVCGVVFIMFHARSDNVGLYTLLLPLLLYAIDICFRLYQQIIPVKLISATSTIPGYVQLTILSDKIAASKVQPGNYCFLHIKEANGCSQFQWHPISICKYNKNSQEMTFVLKDVGNWTGKVCALVRSKSALTIRMYGPYGKLSLELGPKSDGVCAYNTIVLIAGGIGITPMLSTLDWLIDEVTKYPPPPSTSKNAKKLKVTLLCVTRDIDMFSLFQEQFERYAKCGIEYIEIELCLFCTKSGPPASPAAANKTSDNKIVPHAEVDLSMAASSSFPFTVTYSRPNFEDILMSKMQKKENDDNDALTAAVGATPGSDSSEGRQGNGRMAVLVCGPGPVVRSVQQVCFQLQSRFGRESVALHQESFCL